MMTMKRGATCVAAALMTLIFAVPLPSRAAALTPEAALTAQGEALRNTGFAGHGIAYLSWRSQLDSASHTFDRLFLQAELTYQEPTWGLYAMPRVRLEPVWDEARRGQLLFQQVYAFARHDFGELRIGKIYQQFGRRMDYGFYGPTILDDGLKLQGDVGVSAEGRVPLTPRVELDYALQYFLADDRALSLRRGVSLVNAQRQHNLVAHLMPRLRLGGTEVAAGGSAMRFVTVDGAKVLAAALTAEAQWGPLTGFVEVGRRDAGAAHTLTQDYLWTGVNGRYEMAQLRYHLNVRRRHDSVDIVHQPGVEVALHENLGVVTELAWTQNRGPVAWVPDRSVYVMLFGRI